MKRTLLLVLSLSLVSAGACSDDVGSETGVPIDTNGVPIGDGNDPGTDPPPPSGNVARFLEFESAYGDDQVPCQGTDHCSVYVSYTEKRSLKVRYTENGQPAAGQLVRFQVEDGGSSNLGHLSSFSAYSDAQGIAYVEVNATESQMGQFSVRAWLDWEGVADLHFDVLVSPKGQVPLTVLGKYTGTRPVGSYSVRLFRQDDQNAPGCSDIANLYDNATADWQSPVTTLSQSVKKQEFDGLEEELVQRYTILVYGQDANSGTVLAWGCDDVNGEVTWGQSTTVQVHLLDRMPLYAGSYETTSYFDLVSALPPPIDQVVYFILDFFQSPVGGLLGLACELGNEAPVLSDLCDEIFSDPDNPSLDSLTTIGALIVQVLDAIIQSVAADSPFGDVLVGGKDLGDMLTGFQVQGTLTFKTEPLLQGACATTGAVCAVDSDCGAEGVCQDQQGVWADGEGVDAWNMLVVKWSLGEECNPYTDENCGKKNLSFNSFQPDGNAVEGLFGGQVLDFYNVAIHPHSLNVYYGALLNVIIQNALLPQLFGDGSDGSPVVVDSYEEMIFTLVGGKECLDPQWQNDNDLTCCGKLAQQVTGQGGNIAGDVLANMCELLVPTAAAYLESTLVSLDADTGEGMVIGTPEQDLCLAIDTEGDLRIDALGSKSNPCYWDVAIQLLGGETHIDAEFWAVRAE